MCSGLVAGMGYRRMLCYLLQFLEQIMIYSKIRQYFGTRKHGDVKNFTYHDTGRFGLSGRI